MKINHLFHVTSLDGYNGIIQSKNLLNQPSLVKKGIVIKGEGGLNRRIGDRLATLVDKDWYKHFDEARGIYFRIAIEDDPFRYGGDIVLEFSPDLLKQYPNWILNTEENFGFVLGNHGEIKESPFSGELGKTLYGKYTEKDLEDIIPGNAELTIDVPSINLKNLVNVRYKNENIKAKALKPPLTKKSFIDYIAGFLFNLEE